MSEKLTSIWAYSTDTYINQLIPCPSRLMADLVIFFSGSIFRFELDSDFLYFEAIIVRIDELCLGLGEFSGI